MQHVWVEAGLFFFFLFITTHLTDNSYSIKQTRIGIISIQISDSTMSHNGVKILTLRRCLTRFLRDAFSSTLHFPALSEVPLLASLLFFTQTHFTFLSTWFLQQRHVYFSDRWKETWRHLRKKAPHLLGQMFDAFEQYCWSNLPWGSLVTDGL